MKSLFLDANILLDFFRYGQDDITEIRKLVTLIDDQEIRLYTNKLLQDEVERSRDGVIVNSFNEFKSGKFKVKPPNYCAGMPQLDDLQKILKEANEKHLQIVKDLEKDIQNQSLAADELVRDLFSKSKDLEVNEAVISRAKDRMLWNNPPRKSKDSIGDALHWETLLTLDAGWDFHLVSRDGDFASEVNTSDLKEYLSREWRSTYNEYANVNLYSSLAGFFRQNYPQIKLSDEAQKNALIERLNDSPNFSTTHDVIAELKEFEFFTNRQVSKLFHILVHNNQVNWISTDDDVHTFYVNLKDRAHLVPSDLHSEAAIALEVEEEDFFLPF